MLDNKVQPVGSPVCPPPDLPRHWQFENTCREALLASDFFRLVPAEADELWAIVTEVEHAYERIRHW
jgi:hypothetical protein